MIRSTAILAAVAAMASAASARTPQASADLITGLPGFNASQWPSSWDQYSGYIEVDQSAGRRLFYWLQESQDAAKRDTQPLILWQNGGPGCSSVGGGLMTEQGAFRPSPDGTLNRNPWSWSEVANMLYVESPAFVGFSYSSTPGDKVVGDKRTADDLVAFISGFYSRFPQYQGRDLFLSGESYGGHYVPNLAAAIVQHNADVRKGLRAGATIPLRGIATGNAWTVAAVDNLGAAFDWWSHALVSDWCFSGIAQTCNLTEVGPLRAQPGGEFEAVVTLGKSLRPTAYQQGDCNYWQDRCSSEMSNGVNIYEIYADVCLSRNSLGSGEADALPMRRHASHHHHELAMLKALGRTGSSRRSLATTPSSSVASVPASSNVPSGSAASYDPCVDDETATYLNRKDVQNALHVNTGQSIGRQWSDCSNEIDYSRQDLLSSMLPVYRELLAQDGDQALHIFVFSGDVDGIVPVTGTRMWISELGLPEVNQSGSPWRAWTDASGQVGGFLTQYQTGTATNFSFVSVRNSGHMVPTAQASRALDMIKAFLARSVPQ